MTDKALVLKSQDIRASKWLAFGVEIQLPFEKERLLSVETQSIVNRRKSIDHKVIEEEREREWEINQIVMQLQAQVSHFDAYSGSWTEDTALIGDTGPQLPFMQLSGN